MAIEPKERDWLERNAEAFVYAPDPAYAPFEFYDEAKQATRGLARDYLELVERKLGIGFRELRAERFGDILALARGGKVAIVNAVTETPERSEYLLFTKPMIEVDNVIIVRGASGPELGLEDLAGKTVSVVSGYAVAEFIRGGHPELRLEGSANDREALLAVAYGRSDAAILDLASSSYFAASEGITNLRVAGKVGYRVRLSIGVRKDLPELRGILEKALETVTAEERREIEGRWITLADPGILGSRSFRIAAAAFLAGLLVLGLAVLAWNRTLKREVRARTRELSEALELRKAAEAEVDARNRLLEARNEELADSIRAFREANEALSKSEAELGKSLREKETLVRELYHRTKNTMYVIKSMLELQAAEIPGNADAARLVRDAGMRIQAMAMVQEMLYGSEDLSRISMKAYLEGLVGLVQRSFGHETERIGMEARIEDREVLIDVAVPLGLVVNELLTNSLKHAFPGGRRGLIRIESRPLEGGEVELCYRDDGVGLPEGFDPLSSGGLGLRLVRGIAEEQLQGRIGWERGAGLSCTIRFPLESRRARI